MGCTPSTSKRDPHEKNDDYEREDNTPPPSYTSVVGKSMDADTEAGSTVVYTPTASTPDELDDGGGEMGKEGGQTHRYSAAKMNEHNTNCSDCKYCNYCTDCTSCTSCSHCTNCSDCERSAHCTNCTGCVDSVQLTNCQDCENCKNCTNCSGLKNRSNETNVHA